MKYLDASTGGGVNKIFKGWPYLNKEFGVSLKYGARGSSINNRGSEDIALLKISEGLLKKYSGQQIVLLLDKIASKKNVEQT